MHVLLEMENKGALIDTNHLKKLSNDFGSKLIGLTKKIHDTSGSVFNIDSPKQLSEVLFEKMKIDSKGLKKLLLDTIQLQNQFYKNYQLRMKLLEIF